MQIQDGDLSPKSLRAKMLQHNAKLISQVNTLQYEKSTLVGEQAGIKMKPEPFSALQQKQTKFNGGLEADEITQRLLLPVAAAERLKHVEREIAASEQQQRPPANFFKEVSLTGAELSTLPEYKLPCIIPQAAAWKGPLSFSVDRDESGVITKVACPDGEDACNFDTFLAEAHRLAAAANRSTWVSSTELATTILCAGQNPAFDGEAPDDEDSFDEELHSQTKAAVAKLLRKEMLQSDATTSCPASENLTPEMAAQQLEELFDRNANRDEAQVTEIDVPLAWKGPAAYAKSLIDKFPFNQEQLDLLALLVNPLEVAWRNREDTSVYTLPVDLGHEHKAALAMFARIPQVFVLQTAMRFEDEIQKNILRKMRAPGGERLTDQEWSHLSETRLEDKAAFQSPEALVQATGDWYESCYLWSITTLIAFIKARHSAREANQTLFFVPAADWPDQA
ncbi:unnamed protein product [Durusdinium trenchii]|uniref:Uncharacterized protein n=1 Tax=Durusdinium trenchii TaxID=1381693 RepID=A0ABP0IYD5_9DINO